MEEVYVFCMRRAPDGEHSYIISQQSGVGFDFAVDSTAPYWCTSYTFPSWEEALAFVATKPQVTGP